MVEIDDDLGNDQDNETLGRLKLPSKGKDHAKPCMVFPFAVILAFVFKGSIFL